MKYRNELLVILLLTLCLSLSAEPWKVKGDVNLNLNQSAYSNNWAGTELGSITWVASSNLSAEKQLTPILLSINSLKLAFGQTYQQKERINIDDETETYWTKPVKSTDKIDAEALLKMTMKSFVNPFLGVRGESQFLDQRRESYNKVFSPVKLTESAGVTRNFIERGNELLTARFGAAFRQNFDRYDLLVIPSPAKDLVTTLDGGVEFVTEYKNSFPKSNLSYSTKLQIYQAMFNSKADDLGSDDWKAPDVNWEHNLAIKVWKAISINLYLQLLYEQEQISEIQYKETMGLGLSYNLF